MARTESGAVVPSGHWLSEEELARLLRGYARQHGPAAVVRSLARALWDGDAAEWTEVLDGPTTRVQITVRVTE